VTSIREIVTKKRMMLFSGMAHPDLAEEIAAHLGAHYATVSRRLPRLEEKGDV